MRRGRSREIGDLRGFWAEVMVAKQRLAAKYLKMRLEGVIYPDVYCLALMLAAKFDFLLKMRRFRWVNTT